MLARLAPSLARRGAPSLARGMCDTVQVDMVCRVFSCKVRSDQDAHKMDLAFEEYIDAAALVEGCAGASRLVCKSEWDYKLIIKFDDAKSLTSYMQDHHTAIMQEHLPVIEELAVDGAVHQQNFVYDDID